MRRSADSIYARRDGQDSDLDRILAWQNRADGALVLARWAVGASLVSLIAVALQVLATVSAPHAATGTLGGLDPPERRSRGPRLDSRVDRRVQGGSA
jgi:hypothetical protein